MAACVVFVVYHREGDFALLGAIEKMATLAKALSTSFIHVCDSNGSPKMETQINDFFDKDVGAFLGALADIESRVDPNAAPGMDEFFRDTVAAFEGSCDACRRMDVLLANQPERLKEVKTRFRELVGPCIYRSWFIERAFTKPRGYPGDAELLTAIYDNLPRSPGFVGYMDLYFLNTTLAFGVRERIRCAKAFLVEELDRRCGDVSIVNVACGPVREYEEGLEHPKDTTVHITCIDTDRQTLDFVEGRRSSPAMRDLNITCLNHNAIRTSSAQGNIRRFGRPDIIYSIGLCDYIPDKYLVPMLQGWRETVGEGGTVYVAFKDTRKYSPTVYQWHVDWYFFLRTEEDCRALFEQAGYDMYGLRMTRDRTTGSIINFISRNKKPSHIRIDRPEPEVAEALAPAARSHASQPVGS
jgi:extracellular factor (EF) 3-hydroxypalmitic acid methyl ester biosynthesis protein